MMVRNRGIGSLTVLVSLLVILTTIYGEAASQERPKSMSFPSGRVGTSVYSVVVGMSDLISKYTGVKKLNSIKGPAVLFEKVKGFSIPVVAQLLASHRRLAIAIDSSEKDLFHEMTERSRNLVRPNPVSHAPCQEVVKYGNEVNLGELPLVMNNPNDGGFYITAEHVTAN